MISNDIIILDKILEQRKNEVAPDLSDSDFFEIFATEQVLKDFDLSYEEIRSGIVGGGNDGGIDSIYLFINGDLIQEDTGLTGLKKNVTIDLVLIQAKASAGFSEPPLDKFLTVTGELLNLSKDLGPLSKVYNASLLSIIKTFRSAYKSLASRFPTLTVSYYYITKGEKVNPNVERKVDAIREKLLELFSSANFKFEFVGARPLLDLAHRLPQTTHELKLAENPISTAGNKDFVCLVKLLDFYSFITIEQFFKPYGLFYDRRKNFYKNEGNPIEKIISIAYLAQAVMAIALQRPNDARARPSSLLKKDSDYKTVFSDKYPISLYFFCVSLMKRVEKFMRSDGANLDEVDRVNLRHYLAMCAACDLTKKATPTKRDLGMSTFPLVGDELLRDSLDRVRRIYMSLGASDQVAKGAEFVANLQEELAKQYR